MPGGIHHAPALVAVEAWPVWRAVHNEVFMRLLDVFDNVIIVVTTCGLIYQLTNAGELLPWVPEACSLKLQWTQS